MDGVTAEDRACAHLRRSGLAVVQRNYRVRGGEIDIVARAPDGMLVFVEVRARRSTAFGGAAASVGRAKRARLVLAARHYLMARVRGDVPCRFDVVAIDAGRLRWIQDAFSADG